MSLLQSNASLVAHLLRFTRSYLFTISGGHEPAVGYGPKGTRPEASYGSLLSTQG